MSKVYQPFQLLLFFLVFAFMASTQQSFGQVTNQRTHHTYATIGDAIQSAQDHDILVADSAVFNENIVIDKPLTLRGIGMNGSVIRGVKDPSGQQRSTILIAANSVSITGFTITREGNNATDWNDGLDTAGVTVLSGVNNIVLRNNEFTGNNIAIDFNNSSADTIINNHIHFNRIGILFQNNYFYGEIAHNRIYNNWWTGILWLNQDQATPAVLASNSLFDNWYSQIEIGIDNGAQYNFAYNWLGSNPPTTAVSSTPVAPDYEDQIPAEYGGSATPPSGGAVSIRTLSDQTLANTVYAPYYTDADKTTLASILTSPTLLTSDPNSGLPPVSVEIPSNVTVTTSGSDIWDGVIMPPTPAPSDGTPPSGFQIGSTVIEIGSTTTTLYFSSPVTITLQGVTDSVAYKAPSSDTWTMISEGCTGTYDNPGGPSSPTGECFISNGTDTKILTYHFTRFGGLKDLRDLQIKPLAAVRVTANNSGCTARDVDLGLPRIVNKYTLIKISNDAPQVYPLGTTIVTWTIEDERHEKVTGKQTVIVTPSSSVSAAIPAAYALPAGTEANTVYIGYSPASSITVAAQGSGGTGTYSYHWSTGAVTPSITVAPLTLSTYTCEIKDEIGCNSGLASVTIQVQDVRCGNNKVAICHQSDKNLLHEKTICIDAAAVQDHLRHGCKLGACEPTAATTRRQDFNRVSSEVKKTFTINVAPNPSASSFRISLESSNLQEKAQLRVYDARGRVVEKRSNVAVQGVITLGEHYAPGMYVVEVMQGGERKRLKLIRTQQ